MKYLKTYQRACEELDNDIYLSAHDGLVDKGYDRTYEELSSETYIDASTKLHSLGYEDRAYEMLLHSVLRKVDDKNLDNLKYIFLNLEIENDTKDENNIIFFTEYKIYYRRILLEYNRFGNIEVSPTIWDTIFDEIGLLTEEKQVLIYYLIKECTDFNKVIDYKEIRINRFGTESSRFDAVKYSEYIRNEINEELSPNTYQNAALKLNELGYDKRAFELKYHSYKKYIEANFTQDDLMKFSYSDFSERIDFKGYPILKIIDHNIHTNDILFSFFILTDDFEAYSKLRKVTSPMMYILGLKVNKFQITSWGDSMLKYNHYNNIFCLEPQKMKKHIVNTFRDGKFLRYDTIDGTFDRTEAEYVDETLDRTKINSKDVADFFDNLDMSIYRNVLSNISYWT